MCVRSNDLRCKLNFSQINYLLKVRSEKLCVVVLVVDEFKKLRFYILNMTCISTDRVYIFAILTICGLKTC